MATEVSGNQTGPEGSVVEPSDKNPVFLVHGYIDTTTTPWWKILEWRLKNAGYEESMIHKTNLAGLPVPGLAFNSPRGYAKKIAEEIEKVREQHNGKKVDIIAHSMGGLVSRWYIEKLNGKESVSKLITLGTPHYGTYIAYLGYITPAGREMVPGSTFIRELNEDPLPDEVSYTAVRGSLDPLIIPTENAKLGGANNIDVDYCEHIMLVFTERSFNKAILPALKEKIS